MALVPSASGSPRREKQSPRVAAVDHHGQIDYGLDYSFNSMTECSECCNEYLRNSSNRLPKKTDEKYESHCLKLCYNLLPNLNNFSDTLNRLFLCPEEISFLDLSFNELQNIDPILLDLHNLAILLLHGNQIQNIDEAKKLGGLPRLRKLTLHGNPFDTTKNYRWRVLSMVPQLTNFDFSAITKSDRATTAKVKDMPQRQKKGSAQES